MPTANGYLDGQPVTVLRDSGCNTVVVKRSLVPEENFTGIIRNVYLLDGSSKQLPEAKVYVDSPFFRGTTLALCMEKPLYDVVLGNIDGVLFPCTNTSHDLSDDARLHKKTEPAEAGVRSASVSPESTTLHAATTRGTKETKLLVAASNALDVNPQFLEELQREDRTLESCFSSIGKTIAKRSANIEYVLIKGILYRHYRSLTRKQVDQLVVPQSLRQFVLRMAHEGIMAGHQGIKRTTDRILEEFYWPGVQAEVTRFVRSCDICQRTVPKHLVGRVPLGKMPVIDVPFQRVAIDIIGPLSPTSTKGNRFILTTVDCATRYPDAVALPSIETERIAEALVKMFSRVGIPREIVSDRGRSFTSGLMKELSRLLSFQQLPITPYHPMANGLVERFNGTLKQMIRRMCQESPKNWDRYLAPLLFAYREVPQSSLGFSPFDLLYGRYIRGPMSILKELWTQKGLDVQTKTVYGYVVELRDRLYQTCQIAHEELQKAKLSQKKYYDRKAKPRQLCVGDKVLLLLPSDHNKLILTWKGPFTVLEKRSEIDYVVDLGTRTSLFHINLLKKYEERPPSTDMVDHAAVTLQSEQPEEEPELPLLSLKQHETYRDVKVADSLDANQKAHVEQLLSIYHDIFSDVPGKTNLVECKITTTSTEPVNVRQYPIPFAVHEAVEQEVQQMLAQGIIEPSDSPYQSPIVVVKKKDGSMRLCIDFRQLNRVVVMDNEPIPRVDMMFAHLGKARYFSKFDFTKGYWQVPMAKDSKHMTAFQSMSGLYQFRFMPFGIKTAPAVFTRLMRKVVAGIPHVHHYFDDVLIATDTWETHTDTLECFFRQVRRGHLTIKPSKSEIGSTSVKFLGHIVGHGVLRPQLETLEKIQAAKRPHTKKEVRSFLGLTGYYRDFVPNYSHVSHPLTELTRKRAPNKVIWEQRHQEVFDELRGLLSTGPILRSPDLQKTFILRTDASSTSVGAVLMQNYERTLHPVAYASRKLLPRETRYSTVEREGLALVWAVQKFHIYLFGKQFVLQSDHQPLTYINAAKHTNSRILRWSLILMEYDFTVEYIKGSDNVGADYMSRV
uniref:RNA-directed DNA polymerase n=1 Tax=Hyalomma excavatum TaxID=257692 RepID=A0A131XKF8_9ACAR